MAIMTYILIGLYALLTGIAGVNQWKEVGYNVRALLFVIVSVGIIVILCMPNKDLLFILLIIAFVLVHLLAIFQGILKNGQLTYSHHIIRFIFHCIIIFMVYNFIK